MPSSFTLFAVLSALVAPALGHIHITQPKPNQFDANSGTYKEPINAEGRNPYPCKGFTTGESAATWEAGSAQTTVITGTAVHGGGSCQVSLSYDQGKTWTVMKSWIGECPVKHDGNFAPEDIQNMPLDFTIPADAPPGEALFAWSWFNRVGRREMYHNCATVTITGSGTGTGEWATLPAAFEANIGGSCGTAEGAAVEFPNPGPEVQRAPGAATAPPTGDCPVPERPAAPKEDAPKDAPKDTPKEEDTQEDTPQDTAQCDTTPKKAAPKTKTPKKTTSKKTTSKKTTRAVRIARDDN